MPPKLNPEDAQPVRGLLVLVKVEHDPKRHSPYSVLARCTGTVCGGKGTLRCTLSAWNRKDSSARCIKCSRASTARIHSYMATPRKREMTPFYGKDER